MGEKDHPVTFKAEAGYNYGDYEGAYWYGDDPIRGISYYKRHNQDTARWSASGPGEDEYLAEADTPAALADELRRIANEMLRQANDVERLVPDIPAERKQ